MLRRSGVWAMVAQRRAASKYIACAHVALPREAGRGCPSAARAGEGRSLQTQSPLLISPLLAPHLARAHGASKTRVNALMGARRPLPQLRGEGVDRVRRSYQFSTPRKRTLLASSHSLGPAKCQQVGDHGLHRLVVLIERRHQHPHRAARGVQFGRRHVEDLAMHA